MYGAAGRERREGAEDARGAEPKELPLAVFPLHCFITFMSLITAKLIISY